MDRIKLALENATYTKAICIGQGILGETARIFKEQFPGKRAIIIACKRTYDIEGKDIAVILRNACIEQDAPYIFDEPEMHAEWKYIDRLDAILKTTEAIPIAIGSGTINDITKLSSYHTNRPYMIVATAASMDGYVAFGASITKDGAKTTFPCASPQAVIADIDVLATAPQKMTASGYADLFAKVPAGADWILADALGIEPIDPVAFSIVQDGLHDALSDPAGARDGNPKALRGLIEGLMLGGFAMQAYPKSSRPASGADHQFSHLLNMEHFVMHNGQAPSHGFQVSIGPLISLSFYESLLETEKCVQAWPDLATQEQQALKMFEGTDFPTLGATEIKAKYIASDALREQLQLSKDKWDETRPRLKRQLVPVAEAVKRLRTVGAPTTPEDIDLPRTRLRNSIIPALSIRRRFTILDLGLRTCQLDRWTDHLFGKGGLWETN